MVNNRRSNSIMNDDNVGYGDKWHEQGEEDLLDWLENGLNKTEETINKIEQLVKLRFEWDNELEDSLFDEIVKLSNENIGNETMCFAIKKTSSMEEYFYYLREIRDLLAAGYPVEKVFTMVGKNDKKSVSSEENT